jgi:hypothetical protein
MSEPKSPSEMKRSKVLDHTSASSGRFAFRSPSKAQQGARANDLRRHVSCYRVISRNEAAESKSLSCTSRAGEGRGSSLTLGAAFGEAEAMRRSESPDSSPSIDCSDKRIRLAGGHPERKIAVSRISGDRTQSPSEMKRSKVRDHSSASSVDSLFAPRARPNKAPEPTSRSVTSRAFLPRIEGPSWIDLPTAARAAPERAVAHL